MITLRATSRHGRNIIERFGTEWEIIDSGRPLCKSGEFSLLLKSMLDHDMRWVAQNNDSDFDMEIMR